ncbi:MAG: ATP-dependent DNA helicase RecG [Cytophagales bacterium]|nr:ATP-dependent DNA helicase RecG [Cytophagales bacterium]
MASFFHTEIQYLPGVGQRKAELLQKELEIFTFGDLVQHYPFRYEDYTQFLKIEEVHEDMLHVQLKGVIRRIEMSGSEKKRRLIAYFKDETGEVALIWFKGLSWFLKTLKPGGAYVIYGKPTTYGNKINFVHPEIDVLTSAHEKRRYLQPVYSTTEKLKEAFLDSKVLARLQKKLLQEATGYIQETLPTYLMDCYKLISKKEALFSIHFPANREILQKASFRLKFEELFYIQLQLLSLRQMRIERLQGKDFQDASLLKHFYDTHLPFELTGAQKNVIKEIYRDLRSGTQMHRLLQGDVGSGKTMVAFLSMLIVVEGGAQAAMMVPTELLAEQHYRDLKKFADQLAISIALLVGATKKRERTKIKAALETGELKILLGTHALIEDNVQFHNLGLAVIDEQHRFGVMQRAKLWQKNQAYPPHILVMTATPIPRTLAMTLYGDLDSSVIDEMPPGRKPIQTRHYYDAHRLKVFHFLKKQVEMGRQVYIVYPLIEESAKMDYKDLMDGYESICRAFPAYPISIVHGKMKPADRDYEMQRFIKGETKIMVATTVIEVGVNIPNATVMVIENAERFGLAQLHQLRGRVGRGDHQSYCILMTGYKLSKESKARIATMVRTNNGFEIADVDLQLRGPGNLMGVQQSGLLALKIANLGQDEKILQVAREAAKHVIKEDPTLTAPKHANIKAHIASINENDTNWSRIS